jgi:F-type H+-transporting ATPase subunit delta
MVTDCRPRSACNVGNPLLPAPSTGAGTSSRTPPLAHGSSPSGGVTRRVDISSGIQASLSGRYATALFELARDERKLDQVSADMTTIRDALRDSADLRALTHSPLIGRTSATKAIAAVAGALGLGGIATHFLGVLAHNGRLRELPAIIRAFRALAAAHRGEASAEVVSAHPLDATQMGALKDRLRKRYGREVNVDAQVDPAILGGLIVRLGSQQIDGSLRTKLNNLAQAMKG